MILKKLPQSVLDRANSRIADEQAARYFYKSAAAWCDVTGFTNARDYFLNEAEDESKHFDKVVAFVTGWNSVPVFGDVLAPVSSFAGMEDILNNAYQMEVDLLEAYEADMKDSIADCPNAFNFFSDFVRIQNESVIEYATLINKLQNYKAITNGMALFDNEVFEK
jgi:ferritin